MANNSKEEPKTAPQADRWYNLSLGPSFKEDSSNKYCTLRYEFKPASIDKTKAGTMKKTKENRVSVEFQNNQMGKPKVTFEGSSEDYKESDAVLFFDGQSFRLERLHRAVKQLRHLRKPGESSSSAAMDPRLSPKLTPAARSSFPVEVERIDIGGSKAEPALASEHHEDIDIEDIFGAELEDEIADVDVSGDEVDKGPNAAEALRAQLNAEERTSSSSTSASTTSSSDSDTDDDDDDVNSI